MIKDYFLNSKLGVPYSFRYYNLDSFQEVIDELDREGQVELDEHDIFYKNNQSLIYTFEDGRVVVFTGGSIYLFESESYSIWLYDSGEIDRVVNDSPKVFIKSRSENILSAHLISDLVAGVILEFATFQVHQSNQDRDVYLTPNGWLIVQDLIKFENYLLLEDEAIKF
ncbi:hypothetical protein [Neolewinella agarilytica]|uniref:Uncharacterized protein n=1 Tax=Neolewinella agarilytica TaxID=478744 RepID=A0A1H9G4J4_9BACT|nr:hypothetical protein [Neolewinella agarilytica]SEQ44943.1 hypothetical protein SAMN05444359_11033 [Neolewinella agarilytica]